MFGVGTHDAATFALRGLLVTGLGGMAIARPARRATGIDPARSLREQ
jgi:hypothetical protein